jgi:hypothetical protein
MSVGSLPPHRMEGRGGHVSRSADAKKLFGEFLRVIPQTASMFPGYRVSSSAIFTWDTLCARTHAHAHTFMVLSVGDI